MRKTTTQLRKEKKAKARVALQESRAHALFIVYYDMGPERSLEKLCGHLTELGLRKSLNTLKRYSVVYGWQQKVVEEDTRAEDRRLADAEQTRSQMKDRHGRMARTLQSLALAGMFSYQEALKAKGKLDFNPAEIVAMAKAGADLELRAVGEPTLKVEITTVLYNVLIARIAQIYRECNDLPTAEAREAKFALLVDQYQVKALQEVNALVEG